MIKLKDLITEVAWERDTLDFAAMRKIPISAPIMKKVIGDIDVSSFHITDMQNVSKLKSLVGQKKSISSGHDKYNYKSETVVKRMPNCFFYFEVI